MEFELIAYNLEDLLTIKYGKNQKKVIDDKGKYPILGTGGIMGYANQFLYDKPSVLIGRKGSISKVRYIEEPFWTVDTLFYTEVNEEKVFPRYIYYVLSQIDFNYYNEGTTIPSLRTDTLNRLRVSIPSKLNQQKILSTIIPIEEKIKNNEKIICNLEQLAQTLFKRWFVHFEFPNENGDPYKSSGGEMVESELGMIPVDWGVHKLTELVNSISDSINKKKKENAIFLNTSDILNGNILKKEYSLTKEMPGQAKKLIKENDILYSEIRPKNKRFAYINFNAQDYVVSTKLMVLRVNEEVFSSKILYLFLTNDETVNELQLVAEQRSGTFPQITFKQLDHFKFALPQKSLFIEYYKQLEKMIDMQFDLNTQNESLKELRDTLLPKILTGEIELPNETEVTKDVPIP